MFFKNIYHSFPIQLLILNLRKNQVLLAFWVILFAIIKGDLAKSLGVPYLFLDPEYMGRVGFWSFFFMGVAFSGFTVAFHITCYILDSYRFRFLASLRSPFIKFSLNNSLIPIIFIFYYLYRIVVFQMEFEGDGWKSALFKTAGFGIGYLSMLVAVMLYFRFTNKDVFANLASNLDKKLKRNAMNRRSILSKLDRAKKSKIVVSSYFQLPFSFIKIPQHQHHLDKHAITSIFDQNQLNALIIQFISLLTVFLFGLFRETPELQIPAAASVLLLFAMTLMLAGAITYWMRGWALTFVAASLAALSLVYRQGTEDPYHKAFGMDYAGRAEYTLKRIGQLNAENFVAEDKKNTLIALEKWKTKNAGAGEKPYMFFVCSSGGGQRAAVWTMRMLQQTDSLLGGKLMDKTMLMSGASGGLIGAGYYRELFLRSKTGQIKDLHSGVFVENLAKDKLNPMVFALVVGDLTFRFETFKLGGKTYYWDRGYALEQKILQDTEFLFDKNLSQYRQAELNAEIPMMLIAPTIVNSGQKLYISPLGVSYLGRAFHLEENKGLRLKGIDFRRFFEKQQADSLRFVTALRMSATFPYITPSVLLPSEPAMEIMDAGLTDNYGVSDAMRFLYVFREWIAQNTRGAVFINIRDDVKIKEIEHYQDAHYLQKAFTPIQKILGNMNNLQDINNDNNIEYARTWLGKPVHIIELEYEDEEEKSTKASLNWRLTGKEIESIKKAAYNKRILNSMQKLSALMQESEK